jgi:chaperonin GroEL
MGKILKFGSDARNKILSGVEKLAMAVQVTMGPAGKCVIVGRHIGAPSITKDGVSVAREVVLDDPIEELGCQLVKEAAGRSAAIAGDGTTTATVLTYSILKEGLDLIDSGFSPLYFRDGVEWTKDIILEELDKLKKPITSENELINIATISVNNDKRLGKVIGEAQIMAGKDGLVIAEAIPGVKDSYRLVDGLELNNGYLAQIFLDKESSVREMNDVSILICNWEITSLSNDVAFRDLVQKLINSRRSVLLLCKDLKQEAYSNIVYNYQQGTLNICPVKIPKLGRNQEQWLDDFSALTGATIIGGDTGVPVKDFEIAHLGFATRAVIDSFKTKIFEPRKNERLVAEKIKLYHEASKHLLGDLDLKDLRERIAFLSNKTAIISVGYSTELELREKGDRVEDALFAVKAALEEGYVIGGGFALWRAAEAVDSFRISEAPPQWHPAIKIVLEACRAPAKQIIRNAHQDPDIVLGQLTSDLDVGYNIMDCKFENLINKGIIDPKKVTRVAFENALSIALLLITTEAVIADNPNMPSSWQPPAGYRLPESNKLSHKH